MNRCLPLLLMLAVTGAEAGVNKCRGADGKLYFTDKGCPGQHEGWNPNVGYVTDEGARADRAEAQRINKEEQHARAEKAARDAQAAPVQNARRAAADESLRKRQLENKVDSIAATPVERAAAKEELSRINRGVTATYSDEERAAAKASMVRAGSIDDEIARKGAADLRAIGDRHESPAAVADREQRLADRMAESEAISAQQNKARSEALQQHQRDVTAAKAFRPKVVGRTFDGLNRPIYEAGPTGQRVEENDHFKHGSANCYVKNGHTFCN